MHANLPVYAQSAVLSAFLVFIKQPSIHRQLIHLKNHRFLSRICPALKPATIKFHFLQDCPPTFPVKQDFLYWQFRTLLRKVDWSLPFFNAVKRFAILFEWRIFYTQPQRALS